jgi:hypothetical protein
MNDYDNDDLLSTNVFIREPEIEDIESKGSNFKEWYEERRQGINEQELNRRLRDENIEVDVNEIEDISDLSRTNPFNKVKKDDKKEIKVQKRIKKERKTIVSIDSRDRDTDLYPRVNKFKSFLGRTFKNIKSIRLISTEFPNTEGVIKKNINNKVYWRNNEDADLGYPVYEITIRPGSYTATSLTKELIYKFGKIKRRNGSGQYHYFDVKMDLDTDIVTFRSFIIKDLSNNPLSTSEGSGIITITSPNHGFGNGELVEIIGVKRTAGIPSITLNGEYNITFVNTSQFTYEVNVNAIESITGGGNVVKTGEQAEMQLIWGSYTDVLGPLNLGYPNENSSELLNNMVKNPFATKTLEITDVEVGDPVVITSPNHGLLTSINLEIIDIRTGDPTEITVSTAHGLETGDIVIISDTDSTPMIESTTSYEVTVISTTKITIPISITGTGTTGILKIGGEKVSIKNLILLPRLIEANTNEIFLAEKNLSDPINKFNIDIFAVSITGESIPDSYIGTSQLTVTQNGHGFNNIVSAEDNGTGIVKITTELDHNLAGSVRTITLIESSQTLNIVEITSVGHGYVTGENITISDTNSTPIIDGIYYITRINDDKISIILTGSVSVQGTTGISKNGDKVTITGTDSTPNIDSSYNRIEYISPKEFNIYNNDPDNIFPTGITDSTKGILGVTNKVIYYRVSGETEDTTIAAGIKLSGINKHIHDLEVIDNDKYLIRIPDNYATETKEIGESLTRVYSERHGMDYKQTNTTDGETLNKSVSLEGENYVFMVIPTLNEGTLTSSSGLDNIFAKILLSEPPNTLMFNTFLSNAKVYEDTPLSTLNEIEFVIKNNDGTMYNFNEIDYSFSLEIVEYIDILEDSSFSSRRGIMDSSSKVGEVEDK